ncbi:MAG: hypothetical protein JSV03_00705 [Planctomycetota bacterium]|nr:MAG: hypothetical protein JSV03_00705 [Planctomycetota bacterium]
MSEEEFETYLRLLGRFLKLSEEQRRAIGRELRDHMEERLGELLDNGYSREEAITAILDEFGDAAVLASDFSKISRGRKWIMRTTAGTIGIAAAILFVSFLLPENRSHVPAPAYIQADDTASMVKVIGEKESDKITTFPVYVTPESDADRRAREKLTALIPNVEFADDTPFEEILKFLRREAGIAIDVNWTELDIMAIDRTTTLNDISLRNVKLETVIEIILDRIGGPDVELGYDIIDGMIRISSLDDLHRKTVVRVYDCRELIYRPFSEAQLATIKSMLISIQKPDEHKTSSQPSRHGSYGGGGYGGGYCENKSLAGLTELERAIYHIIDVVEELREEQVEDFEDLIRMNVCPRTWQEDGPGTMSFYDGFVVIRHTPKVHHDVIKFLKMLAEAQLARGVITQKPTTQPSLY